MLLTRLYRDILAASVHWQQQQVVARDNPDRPKRVAYQGRPGSYSHAAATRHFAGTPVALEGHDSFRSMLDAVADDRADIALLPIENTTAELLAKWIGHSLRDKLADEAPPGLHALTIEVEENFGQWASCRLTW